MIPRYRAWDNWRERMSVVDRIYIDTKGVRLYDDFGEYWRDFNDVKLMQSTGLKDKNGKEIFEGDIVTDGEFTRTIKNHQTLGFYMLDEEGIERFFSDSASLEDFEEDAKIVSEILEIIGNVYENPELLEVTE